MAFEEVAHAIQQRQYEDAISKDPEPRRQIKAPKKKELQEFFGEQDISLRSLLLEPLGRNFLAKYADVSVKESNEVQYFTRDPTGPQHKLLAFTSDFLALGKRDKDGVLGILDILIVVESHDLIEFFDEAMREASEEISGRGLNDSAVEIQSLSKLPFEPAAVPTFENLKLELESEIGEITFVKSNEQEDTPTVPSAPEPVRLVFNCKQMQPQSFVTYAPASVDVSTMDDSEATGGIRSTQKTVLKRGGTFEEVQESEASRDSDGSLLNQSGLLQVHSSRTRIINRSLFYKLEKEMRPLWEEMQNETAVMQEYTRFKHFANQKVSDKNMQRHRPLGQGAFGVVYGCMIGEIGVVMALKEMNKKRIKKKKAKAQVDAEVKTLRTLALHPSPYCMRLRYAFVTKEAYNVVIPLALGGDLKYQLHCGGFSYDRARIYAAEIAFGISHLHQLGYINRDIKLRNVLLDQFGHCKISDFGLAIQIDNRTHRGRAGTEGYWSPEVISEKRYAYDCDWWSYGCCLFELIAGVNPFSRKHTGLETRNKGTLSGKIKFPEEFPDTAKALVSQLLAFDKKERLCTKRSALEGLLKDDFWVDMDLQAIRMGSGPVPWVPTKGKIYAVDQRDIYDNLPYDLRKVKIKPDDEIAFPYFVDEELHQADLVQIMHKHAKHPRLKNETSWSSLDTQYIDSNSCECVIL